MKIHELAKILGVKSKTLFEECGVDHHMDLVPEEIEKKYTEAQDLDMDLAPNIVVDREPKVPMSVKSDKLPEGVTLEQLKISICCGGTKSPYWEYRKLVK